VLSEPEVLAQAKEFMLPESTSSDADVIQYATVDTQFRKDTWPNAGSIEPEIRETLAPFNHVHLGSGYPDMVMAGPPPEFLEPFNFTKDSVPVIAIEAKGETNQRRGTDVPASDALLQAHDRLVESNAAIAVVPESAVDARVRQLSHELDVGLLSVDEDTVSISEPPVLKGVATEETASAVRWQASAQRIADQSFLYNHPKTYLGIPLAVAANGDTRGLFESKIAKAGFRSGKSGARFLGLVRTNSTDEIELTPLGCEVARYAIRKHGSIGAALEEISGWGGRGNRTDLIDKHEGWGELARGILFQYPATPFLVETINDNTRVAADQDDAAAGLTLPQLVQKLHAKRPAYTVELFIRQSSDARNRVFEDDNSLSESALRTTDVYQSTTVYQYKMMLRHCGILHPDVPAKSTDELTPVEDYWTLRTTLC